MKAFAKRTKPRKMLLEEFIWQQVSARSPDGDDKYLNSVLFSTLVETAISELDAPDVSAVGKAVRFY